MNQFILRFLLALSTTVFLFEGKLFSQPMYKPSAYEINQLPEWARKMYSDNPNVFEVDSLYNLYYENNEFEKTYHTQYYKKWKRAVAEFVDESGFIQIPSGQQRNTILENHYLKKSPATQSAWTLAGPVQVLNNTGVPGKRQSNIYSIDQCLFIPDILYCGTEPGEVYKSADGGDTWTNVSMNENFGSGVTAIEVDPFNGDVVFAGGNSGVFRSVDGGSVWVNVLPQTSFGVNEILINPSNTQIVLAATNKGLYRSVDGGVNWTQLYSQKSYDIKINSANDAIVYLVKNNPALVICEFYISTDSGATWAVQTNGWYSSTDPARNDGGARIAVTPADPDRVYAYLIGESKANDYGFIGVYRSDDGGSSWTLPNGPTGGPYSSAHPNLAYGNPNWTYHQGFYNCAIVANEFNADQILIGGLNLWRSDNGGTTFSSVAGYIGGPLDMHVDNQDFRMVNGNCWISTDGGIYKSLNFFTTQPAFKMHGIHASDYWGFGTGWNEDVMVGGLYHNGNNAYHENYGYGNFLELGGGEAPTGYINPGDNRKAYFSDIGGKILPLLITDPITSFSIGKSPNESYYAAESSELEFHPNCYNVAYIGNENKLWRTDDGGASYNLVYTFGTASNNQVKYIEISSNNPNIIYLNQQPASGNTGTLWKTDDGGVSWNTLPIPPGNSRRMLIALDAADDQNVWIAYPGGTNGNKIYKSVNGGLNWSNISTPVLNNDQVHSLACIAGTDGGIYYCTNRTVYYRNNAMNDWQVDNNGLPAFLNSNIARPFYRDGKIRIASYGKGIWENTLFEQPAFPVARINVDKLTQTVICENDSFYFEDHSFLNHSNASWQWTFQNGNITSSMIRNPVVHFSNPGMNMITLTVTDGNGLQDSDTIFVEVINYAAASVISEGFEGNFIPSGWATFNEDANGQWSLSTNAGGYGLSQKSAIFDNYNINSLATFDDLRAFVNTTNSIDPMITFDIAYAPYGGIYSDTLEVLVSADCGITFTSLYKKGGSLLATSPNNQNYFTPLATQWRTDSIDISAFTGYDKLMVAFRNIGHWGNVIYLDNINIDNFSSSVGEFPVVTEIYVYPNPVNAGNCLQLLLPDEKNEVVLFDLNGKTLAKYYLSGAAQFDIPSRLNSGSYLLQIKNSNKIWNKVVIIK